MIFLSQNVTKYCLIINTLLVLPLVFNIDYVLHVWLGEAPAYSSLFIIIVLVESYFNIMNQMITVLVNATGNLKRNQLYGRTYTLLVLPISYIVLLVVREPIIPMVLTVLGTLFYVSNNLYDVHLQVGVKINIFLKEAVLPVCILNLSLVIALSIIALFYNEGIYRLFLSMGVDLFLGIFIVYFYLLKSEEKLYVKTKIYQLLK